MLIYADKCCGLLVFKINRYFGCAVGCLFFVATAAVSAMAAAYIAPAMQSHAIDVRLHLNFIGARPGSPRQVYRRNA